MPVSRESLPTPSKLRQPEAGRLGAANRTQAAERARLTPGASSRRQCPRGQLHLLLPGPLVV
jgi:hypothetical protein